MKAKNVVIPAVVVVSMAVGYGVNEHKNTIKYNSPLVQEETKATGVASSVAIMNTIKDTLNEYGKVEVINGTIKFKHRYTYENDLMLGLSQKEIITAYGECYYSFYTQLANAHVECNGNTITIYTGNVLLDTDAVHRVPDSFVLVEEESKSSLLSTKNFAKEAQVGWEDTFMTESKHNLNELYSRQELKEMTKEVVRNIIFSLEIDQNMTILVK